MAAPSESNHLQVLVDCFDDIPSIMSKINVSLNDSPTRFKVDGVLRSNKRIDVNRKENAHRVERMATQAMRVLDQLSKIPGTTRRTHRDAPEAAHIAKQKLQALVRGGISLDDFYRQYDVNKSGKISYKDFSDTLLAVSAGLTREETHQLAASLDQKRIGSIEYGNIFSALNSLESQRSQSEASTGPVRTADTFASDLPPVPRTAKSVDFTPPPPPPPLPSELAQPRYQEEPSAVNTGQGSAQTQTQRVQPRTSFAYVGGAEFTSQPPQPREPLTVDVDLANGADNQHTQAQTQTQAEAPASNAHTPAESNTAATLPTRSPSDHHSTTYTPSQTEQEARSIIPRRYFHNRYVNTAMFRDTAQFKPYEFDTVNSPTCPVLNRSRRRAVSVPRQNNLRDSGCSLDPGPPPPSPYDNIFRKSPTSTSELTVNEAALVAKLEHNPFFRAEERHREVRETVRAQELRTLENAVADQIGGGVTRLRKALERNDGSGSGLLNTEEFKFALKNIGVNLSDEQYNELYNRSARPIAEPAAHGYNRGKAVDIEGFTNRIQEAVVNAAPTASSRPSTPTVAAQTARYGGKAVCGDEARRLEKVRVMKKILQSTSKLPNPHAVYNHIDPRNNGYLSQRQLQDALLHMGANLSPTEFNVLMRSVPTDQEGKVELERFEHVLRDEVGRYERANAQEAEALHRSFRHYSRSFQTSDDFSLAHQHTEFKPLCHRRGQAEETETSRRWGQLQDIFQSHPEVVMHAFSVPRPESPTRRSLRGRPERTVEVERHALKAVPLQQLKERLSSSGLPLSEDDIVRVQRTVARRAGLGSDLSGEVSLEKFCDVVGLNVRVKDKDHVELVNTHEVNEDGGVFAPSLKTQHVNPTVSTSFYEGSSSSGDRVNFTGDRRKRSTSNMRGNDSDPSRYWGSGEGVTSSALFPSPMPTFRSNNIRDVIRGGGGSDVVDPSDALRGVISIAPTADHVQRMGRAEAQLQQAYTGQRGRVSARGEAEAGAAPRRAASAPPRTLLGRSSGMLNNASGNIASLLQPEISSASSVDPSVRSRSTAGTGTYTNGSSVATGDSSYAQKLATAAKIARWAPGALSSYYESRERLNLGGSAGSAPLEAGRRMKASLKRHTPAPGTTAAGAAMSQSGSGGSGAASVGSAGSRAVSVSSGAPFATGANFV